MIGQSVINVKSGGRGRLSTFIAGALLMFLIIVLGDLVVQIPMPVLVGIMIMVSIGTFDWGSFTYLKKAPRTDAIVMVATVSIVVITHDLSKGVLAGVLLSAIFFVANISKLKVEKALTREGVHYKVQGQLFFASVEDFIAGIDLTERESTIYLDFSESHVWDDSAVGAIDKIILKLRQNQNEVILIGLNASSKKIVEKLAIYNQENTKVSVH